MANSFLFFKLSQSVAPLRVTPTLRWLSQGLEAFSYGSIGRSLPKLGGAVEACCAHDTEVGGSKPPPALRPSIFCLALVALSTSSFCGILVEQARPVHVTTTCEQPNSSPMGPLSPHYCTMQRCDDECITFFGSCM